MLSFDIIDGGELAAQFRRALLEIGRNIMDPNTDPEASRGMTINIKFVFRISAGESPNFKLIEAENGIWKNQAVENIREYICKVMADMPEEIQNQIVVIG